MFDNAYSSPEKLGLEMIGEAQWGEADYSFDLTVVWRHKESGDLFYADDSGCSCPSPFEDYKGIADLTKATRHEILKHIADVAAERETYSGGSLIDAADLLSKVASLR
ncbi:DUF7574 domain-containing protein [Kineosporia succinea]|uniref:DUF7574 domain-containing protein n=1 Tax=Kineosporia succinea TaxID=84632 RepID=A0ABT9P9G3_9ACTN|nr:hypothetical protein [Kineosporia succinea]MDP9829328.1 hypothetical protein [Kineosporia succinea]